MVMYFFFKQKTAYDMRISDWSSDVCSSDLEEAVAHHADRTRIGGDLLDEEIVVLARLDIGAVLADLGADLLVAVLVAVFERLHIGVGGAALLQDHLG